MRKRKSLLKKSTRKQKKRAAKQFGIPYKQWNDARLWGWESKKERKKVMKGTYKKFPSLF